MQPNIASLIANKLKKGKNVRRFRNALPESYSKYIRLRLPPRTTSTGVYRAMRSTTVPLRHLIPYDPKHIIDRILPIAYKNRNWRFYEIYPGGSRVVFYNTENGQPFGIHKRTGVRIRPRLIGQPIKRFSRKTRNTWENYLKRANRYVRFIKGQSNRDRLLNKIENVMFNRPEAENAKKNMIRYGFMNKNGQWTRKGALFYNIYRHGNNKRVVTKMPTETILRNFKSYFENY